MLVPPRFEWCLSRALALKAWKPLRQQRLLMLLLLLPPPLLRVFVAHTGHISQAP